jgi:glycosyltransferase involved in cell wall biosynthesis
LNQPDVSVLLPARDAEATLGVALASVLKSFDVALEVVLVDHGSVDATRAIAEAVGDDRVRVIAVDGALAFAEALEIGRGCCRAPLIARMDADDLMHPRRLSADRKALLASAELSAIACRVRPFPRRALGSGMRPYLLWQNGCLTAEDIAREIWVEQPLCHPATTFRATALDAVGGYRAGDFPEDYDLFLRLHLGGHLMAKRTAVHHGWRERPDRTTWTDPRMSRDALARRKAEAAIAHFHLASRPVFIAGAGKEGGRIGRALAAAGVTPTRYFDVSARRIGSVRHGVPIEAAAALGAFHAQSPDAFLICAVGTSGSRAIVRAQATASGFVEPETMICVA